MQSLMKRSHDEESHPLLLQSLPDWSLSFLETSGRTIAQCIIGIGDRRFRRLQSIICLERLAWLLFFVRRFRLFAE